MSRHLVAVPPALSRRRLRFGYGPGRDRVARRAPRRFGCSEHAPRGVLERSSRRAVLPALRGAGPPDRGPTEGPERCRGSGAGRVRGHPPTAVAGPGQGTRLPAPSRGQRVQVGAAPPHGDGRGPAAALRAGPRAPGDGTPADVCGGSGARYATQEAVRGRHPAVLRGPVRGGDRNRDGHQRGRSESPRPPGYGGAAATAGRVTRSVCEGGQPSFHGLTTSIVRSQSRIARFLCECGW